MLVLSAALTLVLAACTPSPGPVDATTTPPPTAIEAARLGPTNTPKPATVTRLPSSPTATIQPLEPVTAEDWIRGPLDAEISFLVYCDFQSPPCADFAENIQSLLELRPADVQLIYRQFPLLVLNDKAGLAAELAFAADQQGAFWPMHDHLYEQQQNWTDLSEDDFVDWAAQAALDLGLDSGQIEADLREDVYADMAQDAFLNGVNSGIPGTPFLLLNGEWFRAAPTLTNLEAAMRLELLSDLQFGQPPDLQIDHELLYLATIKLNTGEIVIQLFPGSAPANVANFIFLARRGWYDDTIFHRVVPGRYVEAGDPSATGFGSPGYFVRDEIDPELGFDRAGRVAMVSAGPNTNGSMFAITLQSLPEWQGNRTIFGQVIEGLPLLSRLDARQSLEDLLVEPDVRILSIEIEEQ